MTRENPTKKKMKYENETKLISEKTFTRTV